MFIALLQFGTMYSIPYISIIGSPKNVVLCDVLRYCFALMFAPVHCSYVVVENFMNMLDTTAGTCAYRCSPRNRPQWVDWVFIVFGYEYNLYVSCKNNHVRDLLSRVA